MNEAAQRYVHLLSALFVFRVASASAQSECAAPFVRIDTEVPVTWRAALQDACERISTARDVDDAVTVHVSFQDTELLLAALRDDGRETTRAVRAPAELLTTLRALVMMPPGTARTVPRTAAVTPAGRNTAPFQEPAKAPDRSTSTARSAPIRVEFGAELMGRVAWTPTYLSPALTLHIGCRLDGWMFGLDARAEPYQFPIGDTPSGFEMDGFGAGVFLTRRVIDSGAVSLDAGGRAFLGVENQALEQDELANNASVVDARVGVLTRLLLGRGSARWAIALDSEVSPMRLRREFKIYRYLPAVSVGLGVGVALESP
jgi:hypothetical protein